MNNNKSHLSSTATITVEPKKSARLAEKRKLREEAGPSFADEDYYFSPYSYGKSVTTSFGKSTSSGQNQLSPLISPSKSDGGKGKRPKLGSAYPLSAKSTTSEKSPSKRPTSIQVQQSTSTYFVNNGEVSQKSKFILKNARTSPQLLTASSEVFSTKKKGTKEHSSSIQRNDDESIDEEKWLEALEEGRLEELDDELRQMKNPKLLTARQKALLDKRDKDYVFLRSPEEPCDKEPPVTAEMIQLKAKKTERRRLLAQAKKEDDQKKTVEKLLNKPYSKGKNVLKFKGPKKLTCPVITYINRMDKNFVIFPPGMEIPIEKTTKVLRDPDIILCGVSGCNNSKKYTCSKTGVPLCSLECYKKNMDFFTVTDTFDCVAATICETSEYESAIIDGEIFTDLL